MMLARRSTAVAVAFATCAGVIAEAAPAKKSTIPLNCDNNIDKLPGQIVQLKKTFDLVAMDWGSGERTTIWSIVKKTAPGIKGLNACGINPVDSMIYCMVKLDGATRGYLARVDKNGVAYVASAKDWSFSGTFDQNGQYYMDTGTSLFTMATPDTLEGYEQPWSGLPQLSKLNAKLPKHHRHGADSLVSEGNYISVSKKGEVIITDLLDSGLKTWKPTADAGSTLPNTGFGGAYWYNGKMYFSANNGDGVFKMELSPNLDTYKISRVGESFKTNSNDGVNCLFADAPEPTTVAPQGQATTGAPESMPPSVAGAMAAGDPGVVNRLWSSRSSSGGSSPALSAPSLVALIGAGLIFAVAALISGAGGARTVFMARWRPRAGELAPLATLEEARLAEGHRAAEEAPQAASLD